MKFLIDDNGKEKLGNYPRGNANYKEPLEGVVKGLKLYVVIDDIPVYDSTYEMIRQKKEYRKTKENFEGLAHLLIAYQDYEVFQKDVETVVIELDRELGGYLDSTYPAYQRDKHLREVTLSKSVGQRLQFLKDLDAWLDECRAIRDTKEQQIRNNLRPSLFDWPQIPIENIDNIKNK